MALENMVIPKDASILVLCVGGLFRSPQLAKILELQGYNHVGYKGVGFNLPDQRIVTQEILEESEYIIAVEPWVVTGLEARCQLTDKHKLIILQVDDVGFNGKLPQQVTSELEEQIRPYVANWEEIKDRTILEYLEANYRTGN